VPPYPNDTFGLTQTDGLILLFGFIVVAAVWFISGRKQHDGPLATEAAAELQDIPKPLLLSLGLLIAGLVLLLGGAWAAESGAVDIARHLGVPEVVIGLTIVAIGTSLPEVSTAVIATKRNETDLAVGTVIGSNLFNLVLVMGVSVLIRDIPLPIDGLMPLIVMLVFTLALLVVYAPGRKLSRLWGVTMLVAWAAFMTAVAVMAT
jgi:cation:H+ antiporter